jgi:hypothetical protein
LLAAVWFIFEVREELSGKEIVEQERGFFARLLICVHTYEALQIQFPENP